MKKFIFAALALFTLTGCALISPYSITFTTPDYSVIDPATDTLDLAVNLSTMAYVSEVKCLNHDALALLPVITDEMTVTKAHNLSLEMLSGYEVGTECKITVTVLDQTTTANSRDDITLYVLEGPALDETVEDVIEPDESDDEEVNENEFCDDGTVCTIDENETTNGAVEEEEVTGDTEDTETTIDTNNETTNEETGTSDDSSGEESEA